jgi:thiamine-phosphate pyrophosphorylase
VPSSGPRQTLSLARLYAIVDVEVAARAGWAPADLARAFIAGGARLLQLRAKTLDSGPFLDLAREIVEDAHAAGATVIINDRADIARLAAADGVHVGQEDLSPRDVRRVTGDTLAVGLSTHTPEQIDAALNEPISYLAVGPVFPTSTKDTGYDRVGFALVRQAADRAQAIEVPLVAIGGITLASAARVIEAGARSVAVISDLVTEDPEARVRQYLAALAL